MVIRSRSSSSPLSAARCAAPRPTAVRSFVGTGFAAVLAVAAAAALVNCQQDGAAPVPPVTTEPAPEGLDARALLVRASLDLRGTRPTAAELERIVAEPDELDEMVGAFVDDPRFGERVKSIFAAAFRTRQDFYEFGAYDFDLPEEDDPALQRAMAEELPQIVAHVAVTGAPFTEILTADYTIVDPILMQIWPLEAVAEQPDDLPEGVVMARYTDARPSAGVLSTNAFYWRHTSTVENANRGRTNAISRALLCEDYLERPIDFPKDVDLTDSESIHQAIKENKACQACHATMDPFASHLWGFMQTAEDPVSWSSYHPANEQLWKTYTEAQPAFFGVPTAGTLDSLAVSMARDERFVGCTVRRVYERFLGRRAELEDEGQLAAHREAFLASGLSLKALAKSIVLDDPAYRGLEATSEWGGVPAAVGLKLASVEQLESTLGDFAGYELAFEGRAVTEVDFGLRALAGGSERGDNATPSVGHALVHRRLAEAAARAVVDGSFPDSRIGSLLDGVDLDESPSAAIVVRLLAEVRSLALAEDSDDVLALLELWQQAQKQADAAEAWTTLLTALFADPDLAAY
jgi:hypothetical protein